MELLLSQLFKHVTMTLAVQHGAVALHSKVKLSTASDAPFASANMIYLLALNPLTEQEIIPECSKHAQCNTWQGRQNAICSCMPVLNMSHSNCTATSGSLIPLHASLELGYTAIAQQHQKA